MNYGFTLWLTGPSGYGKSTLAQHLAPILSGQSRKVEILEEIDVWRNMKAPCNRRTEHGPQGDTNIKRIGYVVKLLTRNGVTVIVDAISPHRDARRWCRGQIENFVEVWVDCRFKGLEDLEVFDYETPTSPELYVNSGQHTATENVRHILAFLQTVGYFVR